MLIDGHVHGDPDSYQGDPQELVDAYRRRGVDAVVLIESPDRCLSALRRFGGFVIPAATVRIDEALPEEISDCLRAGCRGIKFIRPSLPYGASCYWPLYERLESAGGVAVFHTGYLMMEGKREMDPARIEHMRAAQIDVVSRRFPDLRIIMAHFSNPWWEEAWKIMWEHPNVYADFSGGTAIRRSTRMWAEMFAPDGVLHEASARKLVFASDVECFGNEGYPFEPYLEFYDRLFRQIGLPSDLRDLVFRGNLRRVFGL